MSSVALLVYLIAFHINLLYLQAEITDTYRLCFTLDDNKYFIDGFAHYAQNSTDYFVHSRKVTECMERFGK
jgi:hypothetical protein